MTTKWSQYAVLALILLTLALTKYTTYCLNSCVFLLKNNAESHDIATYKWLQCLDLITFSSVQVNRLRCATGLLPPVPPIQSSFGLQPLEAQLPSLTCTVCHPLSLCESSNNKKITPLAPLQCHVRVVVTVYVLLLKWASHVMSLCRPVPLHQDIFGDNFWPLFMEM